MNELYDFDDILIEPTILSDISSRKQIDPTYSGRLPLMTAPMDTVIDKKNISLFKNLGITPILPRIKNPWDNYYSFEHFLSYGIDDFEKIFLNKIVDIPDDKRVYTLIDTANGHMNKLFEMSKLAKKTYGNKMVLMVGNVANPLTFEKYCQIGVDYVRIGIGNGDGCWIKGTLVLTNVGYKKIEDIMINDLVLTHDGIYSEVINTISYNYDDELISINGEICTKNHELYVINKKDKFLVNETNYKNFAFFLSADKINDSHLILSWEDETDV